MEKKKEQYPNKSVTQFTIVPTYCTLVPVHHKRALVPTWKRSALNSVFLKTYRANHRKLGELTGGNKHRV
ncbi:hypothetical protein BYT27DRAFT_7257859 [Phlegmacium glaucopus]|nr:hypothetical protein BYT27DRAFT_7257859 [Phlegmacium glaucopus]